MDLFRDFKGANLRVCSFFIQRLQHKESAGHGCQLDLTSLDGGAGQVGQLPVLAQDQVVAVQSHDGGALGTVLTGQDPDQTIVGGLDGGGLGLGVVDDQIALLGGVRLVGLDVDVSARTGSSEA